MQPDVSRIGDALGLGARINQENWIEQAQILAKGGETHYAARRARGEAANAAPTPDEGERRTAPISPRSSTAWRRRRGRRRIDGYGRNRSAHRAVTGATFDAPPDVSERRLRDRQVSSAPLRRCPVPRRRPYPRGRLAAAVRRSARRHRQRTTICCASAASMPRSRAC